MDSEITCRQTWWRGEGPMLDGLVFAPTSHFSAREFLRGCLGYYNGDEGDAEVAGLTTVEGYGARLSMPGYLDCTEWCVFPTEAEAQAYLNETYGNEGGPS